MIADSTGLYMAGTTTGLPGQPHLRGYAYIRKEDFDGHELWAKQWNEPPPTRSQTFSSSASGIAIAPDGFYVVGAENTPLAGQVADENNFHSFVRKFDGNGNEAWTSAFAATGNQASIQVAAASATSAGVFIVGTMLGHFADQPATVNGREFVRMYSPDGHLAWNRQFGTVIEDAARSVTVDSTGVYVVGYARAPLPNQPDTPYSGYIRKYDFDGNEQWTKVGENAAFVSTDETGVYVGGSLSQLDPTNRYLGPYLRKYDRAGTLLWTSKLGEATNAMGDVTAIAPDGTDVYVGGSVRGNTMVPGESPSGREGGGSAFLMKLGSGRPSAPASGAPAPIAEPAPVAVPTQAAQPAAASPAPSSRPPAALRFVQADAGAYYVLRGTTTAWSVVANSIGDDDLAAVTLVGEIHGTGFDQIDIGSAQVVRGGDGRLYLVQGQQGWAIFPDPIGDADVAALNIAGEIDGIFPDGFPNNPSAVVPATPTMAPDGAQVADTLTEGTRADILAAVNASNAAWSNARATLDTSALSAAVAGQELSNDLAEVSRLRGQQRTQRSFNTAFTVVDLTLDAPGRATLHTMETWSGEIHSLVTGQTLQQIPPTTYAETYTVEFLNDRWIVTLNELD